MYNLSRIFELLYYYWRNYWQNNWQWAVVKTISQLKFTLFITLFYWRSGSSQCVGNESNSWATAVLLCEQLIVTSCERNPMMEAFGHAVTHTRTHTLTLVTVTGKCLNYCRFVTDSKIVCLLAWFYSFYPWPTPRS